MRGLNKLPPWPALLRGFCLVRPAIQAGFFGIGIALSFLAEMHGVEIFGLLVVGASLILAKIDSLGSNRRWSTAAFLGGCAGMIASLCGLFLSIKGAEMLDGYYALIAGCIAVAIIPNHANSTGKRWLWLAAAWFFGGSGLWLSGAYLRNDAWPFFGNWLVCVAGLVLLAKWVKLSDLRRLALHTVILFMVALPLTNLGIAPHQSTNQSSRTHSVTNAPHDLFTADQADWAKWWPNYLEQWSKFGVMLCMPDPDHVLPFRLKPNSEMMFGNCPIKINRLGFRDREFAVDKAGAYRIICLGESTTFGATLETNDVPWPQILEKMIQDRFKPGRRVEVINAGVPSYHLLHNVMRLKKDILPLQPDMIISYHGFNGFPLLNAVLPSKAGVGAAPTHKNRPIHLLANVEYRSKLWLYHRRQVIKTMLPPAEVPLPLETPYARAYETLIETCRAQGIELVLCNYSMAMNRQNPTADSEFYHSTFPPSRRLIQANSIHTLILKELVRRHPQVHFVDTHPQLDGCAIKFLDLLHFRQAGRQQLAENIFSGISNVLVKAIEPVPRQRN